jgi:hypothetical protein
MATKQRSPSSGEERAGFNRWGATAFKSRRSAFLHGVLAGLLLWLGADAFCLGRWDHLLPLPAGALGDAAALLLMAAWGALVLLVGRQALAEPSLLAPSERTRETSKQRKAPPKRAGAPGCSRRAGSAS